MAEAKTQITAADRAHFIEGVEPDKKREEAGVLDAMFRKVTGEIPKMWGPSIIGYGAFRTTYASGRDVHWLRSGFSPREVRASFTRFRKSSSMARSAEYPSGQSVRHGRTAST